MDKDKKWDRKEVVVEWMFISMGREKIMESMHMVGAEPRKKPEKMLTNIGGKIMNELIFGVSIGV